MLSNLLTIVFPTFGVIGVGWLARRINVWNKAAVEGLNNYAYYIALPALIFQSLIQSDLSEHFTFTDATLLIVVLAVHLGIMVVSGFFLSTQKRLAQGTRAAFPVLITFGSTAYLGIPYATQAFGQEGTAYASLISVLLVTVLLFTSIFIFNRFNRIKIERHHLRYMVELPFLWAVLAGILWPLLQLPSLPPFLSQFLDSLAAGASATALLGLGAFLYDIHLKDIPWKSVMLASVLKVVLPAVIIFFILRSIGIHGIPLATAVAMAATPCAITSFILSEKYRLGERLTAGSILVSVFLSFLALIVISYLWLATNIFQ